MPARDDARQALPGLDPASAAMLARAGVDWRVIARERRTDITDELDARRRTRSPST